jgi:hypothetical protein
MALSRGFGFLMTWLSRDQIAGYFKEFLDSLGSSDVLERWKVPVVNFGGSGTYFTRKKQDSEHNIGTGIQDYPVTGGERTFMPNNPSLAIDFREEWFDAGDVEGFLEEYGVLMQNDSTKSTSEPSYIGRTLHKDPLLTDDEHKITSSKSTSTRI